MHDGAVPDDGAPPILKRGEAEPPSVVSRDLQKHLTDLPVHVRLPRINPGGIVRLTARRARPNWS